MLEIRDQDIRTTGRRSSKGNQLKAERDGYWYKADYAGYEGLAEYTVSARLTFSDLSDPEYVRYDTEQIRYRQQTFLGCRSADFLEKGSQMFTLERLFQNAYGKSLYEEIFHIEDIRSRIRFLVEHTIQLTGLRGFGIYLSKMLAVDALFLNEDRHMHNIAVILGRDGKYQLCPLYDHGGCLLSDTTVDYPMGGDLLSMIDQVKAKTCSASFDEQLDTADALYGQQIRFSFTHKDVQTLLDAEPFYPAEVKNRVRDIIYDRMRKYRFLFN